MTDPVAVFNEWMEEARAAGVEVPEAMTLATADAAGRPSARMLLLKGADERGFTFFSGYESRKGRELDENPRAALVFYWQPLGRQVRVEGTVAATTAREADAYFATRARDSRIGAWASDQSRPLKDRAELEQRFQEASRRYPEGSVPRPQNWSGFRIAPARIEFWQERPHRLHDRVLFTRDGETWQKQRLFP